ncbi:MAG: hypothetical protein ACFCUU_01500, partial [Cyclobacteriaceae bacterium]
FQKPYRFKMQPCVDLCHAIDRLLISFNDGIINVSIGMWPIPDGANWDFKSPLSGFAITNHEQIFPLMTELSMHQ